MSRDTYVNKNNWRPKGWKNPYELDYLKDSVNGIGHPEHENRYKDFEAGASKVVEALFKMAEESPTKTFTIDSNTIQIYRGQND